MLIIIHTLNIQKIINLKCSTDGDDFTSGIYMITFNEGDSLATTLSGCASIPTTVDDVLEGPHSFFVNISDIRPDGALTVDTPDITEVTINDLNGNSINTTCYLTVHTMFLSKDLM